MILILYIYIYQFKSNDWLIIRQYIICCHSYHWWLYLFLALSRILLPRIVILCICFNGCYSHSIIVIFSVIIVIVLAIVIVLMMSYQQLRSLGHGHFMVIRLDWNGCSPWSNVWPPGIVLNRLPLLFVVAFTSLLEVICLHVWRFDHMGKWCTIVLYCTTSDTVLLEQIVPVGNGN